MQNSGVTLRVESQHFASVHDDNPCVASIPDFGFIEEIWELNYVKFTICVFKCVEAMSSKVILMMPKNQESSKFQRFKNEVFKNQDSRIIKIKIQDSRFKIQESREESIKISIKKVFQNIE